MYKLHKFAENSFKKSISEIMIKTSVLYWPYNATFSEICKRIYEYVH